MSSVLFDGSTVIRPQARVRVDDQGLIPTVLGAANVLMMFGPALGGQPKTIISLTDPQEARRILIGGDLLTAALAAWGPSEELPGASTIQLVRVNPATQSQKNFQDSVPADLLNLKSLDYGVWTTGIQAKIEAGTTSGKKVTIQYAAGGVTEVFDNLANVAAVVAAINNPTSGSTLVLATFIAEGTLTNVAFTPLVGGSEGTLANSDWQDGFNLMNSHPANVYQAVTADASVHALLISQNLLTVPKLPGIVINGHGLSETLSAVLARQASHASSYRSALITPGIKKFDSNGNVVTMPSYLSSAPQLAGLICGLPLQRPPTYKTLAGLGLEKDYSQADLDTLEQSGVIGIENIPNRGLRIVHGQTNWTSDLNAMKREISVGRIRDLLSVTLKTDLEAFVGEPGTQFTIAAIKARVESVMTEARNANLITDGVDNAGNPQPAFRNILVRFNSASGIAYVEVEASPVTPVNYVLITAHFTATNIVA